MSSPKEEKDNNIMRDFKKVCVCDKIKPIGFIGCGNMGTAILTGIIKSKLFEPEDIIVSAQSDESIERLKKLNVTTTKSNLEVFDGSRIIFLCIKPNKLEAVAKDLVEYDTNKPYTRQLVSILAGN
jgi:pyrroline-5-carboxylate reductase